jgi:hypothetical protein
MTDAPDSLYLDLWMAYPQNYSGAFPVDPIDSLQTLYDIWKSAVSIHEPMVEPMASVKVVRGSGGTVLFDFTAVRDYNSALLEVCDMLGRRIATRVINSRLFEIRLDGIPASQILLFRVIRTDQTVISKGKFIF